MAEFKLGRIKFVWQGDWSPSTDYVVDDVIRNAGQSYICVKAHTSTSLFATDFSDPITKWKLIADGQRWTGDWQQSYYYETGDIAKFGGNVYVCVTPHTSSTFVSPTWFGIEIDLGLDGSTVSKWELFASSVEWQGDWVAETRYRINDFVVYGGTTYICNHPHVSDNRGLEYDISRWDIFNQGVIYLGDWSDAGVRYKLNDLVKYGADLWICIEPHNSEVTFDQTKWDVFVNGLEFENSWNSSTVYQIGDVVTYGGYSYVAKTNNNNSQPTANPTDWDVFITGFSFQGDWSSATSYKVGEVVRLGGYTYVANANSTNQKPPNNSYWDRLNSGLSWTFSTQTFTGLSGTNVVGTGTSATFDVVRAGTVYTVTVNARGSGYATNDKIKILGSAVGGTTPANDIIITVSSQTLGEIDLTNGITWTGRSTSWKDGTDYNLGDTVLYGANTYICVNGHTAGVGNSPGVDTTASYWNLLTAGSESSILTTEGDMFYMSPIGPARLPIGQEGDLLRVTSGYPSWETYGVIKNLVYVGPLGVDSTESGYGLTIDKPWKTVRFACEQVEQGYQNREAALILRKNKQFIIKEVTQYVEYTYPGIVDLAKTERDAGIALDAIIYDVSHGGNGSTITATYEYFNAAGDDYVNSTVGSQVTQFVAGLEYLNTVTQAVLNNLPPSSNYQTLNSYSPAAQQIVDSTLTVEEGVATKVTNLVTIVTDALTAGNTAVIPLAEKSNTTISVKTGTYNECLPIVIPNYTAIVGDELRSTVIQPKAANDALVNHKPRLINVLGRLKSLVPDLMANNTITPTAGNNEVQDTSLPAGSIGSTTAVNSVISNTAIVRDILENGLQQVPAFVLPNPTNYNTSLTDVAYAVTGNTSGATSTYGDGKGQIVQNYQFIKDEIAAYLNVFGTWSSYSIANRNKTLRDLSYILDALQYDMTYGGNRLALITGRSYYSLNLNQLNAPYLAETVACLGRLKTIIGQIVQKTSVTPTAGNTTTQVTTGTAGNSFAALFAQNRVQDVIDWINNGVANATVEPAKSWQSSALLTAFNALQAKRSEIAYDSMLWFKKYHQSMPFDQALAERDGGDVVDALSYDVLMGSNFYSLTAGRRYRSETISNNTLIATMKTEVSDNINFMGDKAKLIAASGSQVQVETLFDDITAQIKAVVSTTLTTATTSTNVLTVTSTSGMYVNMPVRFTGLPANFATTATATAVSTNLITLASVTGLAVNMPIWFTGNVFGNVVKDQKYYIKTLAGNQITISLTVGGTAVSLVNAAGTMTVTVNMAGGLYSGKTYWVNTIPDGTTLTITDSYKSSTPVTIGNTTTSMTATITVGVLPEINGTISYNHVVGDIQGAEILRANKEFLAYEATAYDESYYTATVTTTTASNDRFTTSAPHPFLAGDFVTFTGNIILNAGIAEGTTYYILDVPTSTTFRLTDTIGGTTPVDISSDGTGTMTVSYTYDSDACRRDVRAYVDGFIDDLNFVGNHKSIRAAIQYVNAVDGSEMSNMFYVGNGTGLRNCTMVGLTGTLTAPNAYGTRRPTAGAYTSLNPGFGPADSNVWVKERSHYSQNCTMFGTACTGAKIDSALHDGGNKSMVKNDYTTILSDGIGVWCTGSSSLVELVSVFNYYGYSGYLAELGGRIRATNGNSSYGTYGVIAEGVDSYEVPLYGVLDNRANPANVGLVVTDSVDKVQRFEYVNAGQNYTNYIPDISGAGYNATAIGDEFRDQGVFETRLIDLNDNNGYGGSGYLTFSNVAQGGDATYITIAATDTQLSPAYVGMRVVLNAGTGAGQYGGILTYNNGSKVAKVFKESFTNLTVTAASITGNLLTVADTSTLYVGMPIYLSGTMSGTGGATGLTANTLYYIIATGFSSTQFAVSTSLGGSAVTISNNVTGLTISLYAAGWDHVIPGTTTAATLDLTTGYIIEPRLTYTHPGFRSTSSTLSASTTWGKVTYGAGNFIAITSNGNSTSYTTNGTWNNAGNLPASTTWADVVYGGGQGATATATIGGLGGSGAVFTVTMGELNTNGDPLPDQVASVTVVNGGYGYSSPPTIEFSGGGGGSGTIAVAKVLDGVITEVIVTVPGSGYSGTPTAIARTDILTGITIETYGRDYTLSTTTATVTGGGASVQATLTVDTVTNGGVYEISIDDGGTGYTSVPTVTILDSKAKFVAVRTTGATNSAYKTVSALGISAWTSSSTTTPSGTFAAMAYGGGVWVAVGGTATATSSDDGDTWASRTITTTTGTWSAVAYGNGTFVAISTGDNKTSYSTNGNTWTEGGNLPSSTTWTSIAYGNGRFVAIASGGRSVAYSLDKGVTWLAVTPGLPSSQTWTSIAYGQGQFVAIASGTTVAATSPFGTDWTARALVSSSNWNDVVFGNPSSNPMWLAISNTSGQVASKIKTGARAGARAKVASNVLTEIRMWEPGSGYPKGTVTATATATNLITTNDTSNLVDSQPIEFTGLTDYGLDHDVTYYVIGSSIVTDTSFKVSATAGSSTPVTLSNGSGLTGTYRAGPTLTQVDPNKTVTAATRVRLAEGVLGNPSLSNQGTANTTATASISGDGFEDTYQPSNFINIRGIYEMPIAGANIEFAHIPGQYFKLVAVSNILGTAGDYTATWQINPSLTVLNSPADGDLITTRIKYSQVRLTGHDFLYIGTGNFESTNYPYVDPSLAIQANQTYATGGGRVFFTSTDQDGNFNVGNLFGVQQSTGTATLNASAFNLSGLQSLQLGSFSVGASSAIITQFSTDPYFTANSDAILPTQRAIKSYITSQIGGGQSSLNVNTLTAGVIYVANNTISTTSGAQINVKAKMNFTGGIDGAPVALAWFMQR